jgi:hypothetical protein
MKAELKASGRMVIRSETEAYALGKWADDFWEKVRAIRTEDLEVELPLMTDASFPTRMGERG